MAKIINFQLFADGGEGTAAEVTTATDGANALDTAEATAGAEVKTEEKSRDERYAEFKTEFKDLFQSDFDSAFGKRFKNVKQTEEKLKSYEDELQPLYDKYKVDNPKDLTAAFLADTSHYLEQSAETGDSPEALAAMAQLKAERDRRARIEAEQTKLEEEKEREERGRQTMASWEAEGAKVKELHPEFDLRSALSNPDFQKGLRLGMPMLNLYRTINYDAITNSIKESARKAAADEIRNGQGRPSEVGAESLKAVKHNSDVNSLSDADIDDILSRVARGEKVTFSP